MGSPVVAGLSGLATPAVGLIQGAAVGRIGPPGASHIVTVGNDGGIEVFGFDSAGGIGAVSPTTANGVMITRLYWSVTQEEWHVAVNQTGLPLGWFASIAFQVDAGFETHLAANALTHGDDGGDTLWTFNAVAGVDWIPFSDGQPREVNWVF